LVIADAISEDEVILEKGGYYYKRGHLDTDILRGRTPCEDAGRS
jgi:hypothetical protein